MKRKKLLSACVAMALSGQTWAADVSSVDTPEEAKKASRITCPVDLHKLSAEQLKQLPPECRQNDSQDGGYWLAGGVAVAGVIATILAYNHDNDSHHHHNDNPPVPPTPPVPPDDGGDVTPPDDGGDVTPPDDGGDVTPPDDGGDVTPPDDGGDVTPPDDGGDVTPPDDGGDDTPTYKHIEYNNNVIWDEKSSTLKIRDNTFTYSKNDDGTYTLTGTDGRTFLLESWFVDEDSNTIMLDGSSPRSDNTWMYDNSGTLYIMKENGITVDDPSKTMSITGHDMVIIDSGGNTALNGATVMEITGNNITIINEGDTTANGEGSIVGKITGDHITITNDGDIYADGGTAAKITGDYAVISNIGNSTITNGGTGTRINGDNAGVNTTGNMNIDGAGSAGIKITGNDAAVNVESEIFNVTNGATGIDITGDDALVVNKGDITADGAGSTSVRVNGDNASIAQDGALTISGGAHGIDVKGDGAKIRNTGEISVSDAGSVGMVVKGDNADIEQKGDLLVTHGAQGIEIDGNDTVFNNESNITVRDAGSTGVLISGDRGKFTNTGDIDVSQDGTGVWLNGDNTDVVLDGNVNVSLTEDDTAYFHATGVNVTGDNSHVQLNGTMDISFETASTAVGADGTPTGLNVSGESNTVDINGALGITTHLDPDAMGSLDLAINGVNVTGDGNVVNINQGLNIDYDVDKDSAFTMVEGVHVEGNNTVNIGGNSVVDIMGFSGVVQLATVSDGGHIVLDDEATLDITFVDSGSEYYANASMISASGSGSTIENKATINATDNVNIMDVSNGASLTNAGKITVTPAESTNNMRSYVILAKGDNSVATNTAGGTINITSTSTPVSSLGDKQYPIAWYHNTYYAMMATNNGSVINDEGGTINLQGAGLYGMGSVNGSMTNAGTINVDSSVPVLDENGAVIDSNDWAPPEVYLMSSGMVAGSTDSNSNKATALNTGTINVNNEGFGMMALNGGTAINQGTINLTADEGVTQTDENQLVGMVALNGGIVINDTSGTINIDADYGKPFYGDSTSGVINYGTICVDSTCQDSDAYNPTDEYVNDVYRNGVIANTGETVTLPKNTQIMGDVGNNGTVNDQTIAIQTEDSRLTNNATGVINSAVRITDGELVNDGTINGAFTQQGGDTVNNGNINSRAILSGDSHITNSSTGQMAQGVKLTNTSQLVNEGTVTIGSASGTKNAGMVEINDTSLFDNEGMLLLDNNKNAIHINQSGTLYNGVAGTMTFTDSSHNGAVNMWGGNGRFINAGTINASSKTLVVSADNADKSNAFFWNQEDGIVNYDRDDGTAIKFTHNNFVAENDGTMNISGNNAVAMDGGKNAQLVNNGTINLGTENTTDTGMIAMQLDASATSDAVIENNGTINIYANDSYAFSVLGAEGHVVNNGTVVIADGVTGSGLIKQGDATVEGVNGNDGNSTEVHYADYTLPDEPNETMTSSNGTSSSASASGEMNNLSGYVVGTNADGSAGQLMVSNASLNGVEINAGFAAGTDATTMTFNDVVQGDNLTDADAITSSTVVWSAQGSQDASGNVDVTMTKNAYADVATDSSVSDVAKALDAGYTNNELYTSLNVGTTAELNSALKQISGSQATTVFREARVLSNRFSMLADAAPQVSNGLAFNVVAKGDPRAELGNDTQYDMLALRKTLDLTASQSLSLEYGIARLDGNGSDTAGDNGVTGGYSQFFGLKHQMSFDNGMSWNNALRYDVHNLDSSRSVAYSDVNKTADASVKQQYLEFRSEGAKTFELGETVKVTPYAGVKLRHTLEDGYRERNAGDFNLNMNSGSETAVDSIVGLKLDYAGKNGWSANATLEGGPNLSYAKSQRSATLAGAGDQRFNVDDGQQGGGVNSLATVGVKYSGKDSALHLDAYQWKEDGISDKGFMLNFKKQF
ncbi:autotransporter domain-containing protein [Salmonella enterica]|nr:autotransporter domain-containing protein [Salmonella enterica]